MKMPALALAFGLAATALVSGCSGISVSTDFDPKVDFSAFKTYGWHAAPAGAAPNPLVDARIRRAVDDALPARGYRAAASPAEADFLVAHRTAVQQRIEVSPSSAAVGYRSGRWGAAVGTGADVRTYDEGTLVLDFVDAKSKELVWRGTASGTVHGDLTPEEREARIREAVTKLLEKFPPGRKP